MAAPIEDDSLHGRRAFESADEAISQLAGQLGDVNRRLEAQRAAVAGLRVRKRDITIAIACAVIAPFLIVLLATLATI